MFLRNLITTSTESCSEQINRLKNEIKNADAIVIGAGAGMSTSAGLTYDGERFEKYFPDFHKKYGISDMYSGGFYPYETLEEYWAWWSRHIYINRYDITAGKPYMDLLNIVKDKDYFVLTTNVDHQFQLAGFDKKRLFYTQGDYGLWQCSRACHDKTYDNEETVRLMIKTQKNMKIPSDLIPKCPVCGAPMTMNLRCDNSFVKCTARLLQIVGFSCFPSFNQKKRTITRPQPLEYLPHLLRCLPHRLPPMRIIPSSNPPRK